MLCVSAFFCCGALRLLALHCVALRCAVLRYRDVLLRCAALQGIRENIWSALKCFIMVMIMVMVMIMISLYCYIEKSLR